MRIRTIRALPLALLLLGAALGPGCAARNKPVVDALPDPCEPNYVACRNGCPLEDATCDTRCLKQAEACARRVTRSKLLPRRCTNDRETCVFNCETTYMDVTSDMAKCTQACEERFQRCLNESPAK